MEQFVGKVLSGGANRIRDNGLQRRRWSEASEGC